MIARRRTRDGGRARRHSGAALQSLAHPDSSHPTDGATCPAETPATLAPDETPRKTATAEGVQAILKFVAL